VREEGCKESRKIKDAGLRSRQTAFSKALSTAAGAFFPKFGYHAREIVSRREIDARVNRQTVSSATSSQLQFS
jgi:hypothetical protein